MRVASGQRLGAAAAAAVAIAAAVSVFVVARHRGLEPVAAADGNPTPRARDAVRGPSPAVVGAADPSPRATSPAPRQLGASGAGDSPSPFAPSLIGTRFDGGFDVDDGGSLRLSPRLIRRFDHLLSTLGERTPEAIRAELQQQAALLPDASRAELLALYDDYVTYRSLAVDRATNLPGGAHREALASTHAAQDEVFGEARAEALFGVQRTLSELVLARNELHLAGLPDDEIARRTAHLEARLPEAIQAGRRARYGFHEARAEVARARASGASERDVDAIRVAALGPDAAARLRALDDARGLATAGAE